MERIKSLLLLCLMTQFCFSCDSEIREGVTFEEKPIDSDVELFQKNLQRELSGLNNSLKENNFKLGNLKDMEILYSLNRIWSILQMNLLRKALPL